MLTTDFLFGIHRIYEHTTITLGVASLIMGATLLTLAIGFKHNRAHSKQGFIFLAAAMFALCVINFAEYIVGEGKNANELLAITIFAASVELFLLFFAYMSMLSREFVTRRRMYIEVSLIAIFTVPALFVSQEHQPVLFDVLFIFGAVFYTIKLMLNAIVYREQLKITTQEIENYHSRESGSLLGWVNNTFYLVLAVGLVSIVVPITNLLILTIYNASLFFAYSYIYISAIRNIDLFNKSMEIVGHNESKSSQLERYSKKRDSFITLHQKFLDSWIEEKGFCVAGVTAGEVATQLHTNRTRLSRYLKEELKTNYYEWIAGLRMEEAKRQLTEYPGKSVINIANDVGIEDRYNFGRVFQRVVGMSPTAYRKKYSEENPQ